MAEETTVEELRKAIRLAPERYEEHLERQHDNFGKFAEAVVKRASERFGLERAEERDKDKGIIWMPKTEAQRLALIRAVWEKETVKIDVNHVLFGTTPEEQRKGMAEAQELYRTAEKMLDYERNFLRRQGIQLDEEFKTRISKGIEYMYPTPFKPERLVLWAILKEPEKYGYQYPDEVSRAMLAEQVAGTK